MGGSALDLDRGSPYPYGSLEFQGSIGPDFRHGAILVTGNRVQERDSSGQRGQEKAQENAQAQAAKVAQEATS